jgi:membrane protein required for colicin V production
MVAIGIVFVCIFVLTIIIGKFIGSMLSRAAEGSGISLGNRLFGGVFGFLRGFLIVLVVIFLAELTPLGLQVIWSQSQIIIAYRPVVKWLDDLIQPGLQGIKSTVGGAMDKVKQNYGGSGAGNLLNQ